jgi:hypothetical protein
VQPDRETVARSSLRRSLFLYSMFLAAVVVVIVLAIDAAEGAGSAIVISIAVVIGVLLLYQVVQHARDLNAPFVESEGVIQRKWTRADLIIFFQGHYLIIDRTVFRVPVEDYLHVEEGNYVKVVHLPHTLSVVSVHPFARPGGPDDGGL